MLGGQQRRNHDFISVIGPRIDQYLIGGMISLLDLGAFRLYKEGLDIQDLGGVRLRVVRDGARGSEMLPCEDWRVQ